MKQRAQTSPQSSTHQMNSNSGKRNLIFYANRVLIHTHTHTVFLNIRLSFDCLLLESWLCCLSSRCGSQHEFNIHLCKIHDNASWSYKNQVPFFPFFLNPRWLSCFGLWMWFHVDSFFKVWSVDLKILKKFIRKVFMYFIYCLCSSRPFLLIGG